MRLFVPPVSAAELPARFPAGVHALARRAGDELAKELGAVAGLERDGKMFGVLVVADAGGQVGYLAAFSGMLGGTWEVEGFAPPVFDAGARDAFWPAGERELGVIDEAIAAVEADAGPARAELAAVEARQRAEKDAMRERHRVRRAERHAARAAGKGDGLDAESRRDGAERRRLDEAHAAEREPVAARVAAADAEIDRLRAQRAARSRELLCAIQETYRFADAGGEWRGLRELFAPAEPPGGAGDCAGPKLLADAYRRGLRPIAMAELWWGAPPATGGRISGGYYPPCRGKCGPILAHMLRGLDAEVAPEFGAERVAAAEPRIVFEDDWIVIVVKPPGLLSVPGRSGALRDSVQTRLRARWPNATVVHRLDLDASGLMVCAKDEATHVALQAQFARREVDKRYEAWLDGAVTAEGGVIELPLRVDLDDRPRQIVDPVHGKPALTEWRVLAREGERTCVEMMPRTGRSHQLRVHAAHRDGIGTPIVGDRLYGRGGERLMLHAVSVSFVHPQTRERVTFEDALYSAVARGTSGGTCSPRFLRHTERKWPAQ